MHAETRVRVRVRTNSNRGCGGKGGKLSGYQRGADTNERVQSEERVGSGGKNTTYVGGHAMKDGSNARVVCGVFLDIVKEMMDKMDVESD